MDRISELLKEARPLYFRRKKRNEIIKKAAFIIMPFLFISLAIIPFGINYSNNNVDYYTSSTSIVEQMGFPTDDYGLLKVD